MKYIKQFLIIIAISLIGELLRYWIPLPIPASIYGLVLMLAALKTKIIPLEKVKDAGKFLIDVMPVMFIPVSVELLYIWGLLKPILIPALIAIVVSTVAVIAVTGRVAQGIIKKEKRRDDERIFM